jgi:signal transduction histidine kinase
VAIDVMDRGPGIADDDQASIFAPYVRLEDEATRHSQGSGLGLALVKAYVEDHGGRVGVAARPGGGSIFSLILPASRGERAEVGNAD